MNPISYQFEPGRRSIFAEIYFPKKAAYQGAVYRALEKGLNENFVRQELLGNTRSLYETELSVYPQWFDPERYDLLEPVWKVPTIQGAQRRMEMYASPFFGWSMYEVDGVFLKDKRIDEERTQVIRLIFKFEQPDIEAEAHQRNCFDVYRSILYWVMTVYGHTEDNVFWSTREQERFLTRHAWEDERRVFAEEYYRRVASAIAKWIDDCGLFVFGYLVRAFWVNVSNLQLMEGRKLEDEIWVASVFHLNVNVIRPVNPPGQIPLRF